MTTPKTLSAIAAEANTYLHRDSERDVVLPVDSAPRWFTDICLSAHGEMMPDDWRYEFIEDALTAMENEDEEPGDLDSLYPYTHDRLTWLSSRLDRTGFCDEAMEEMGAVFTSTDNLIALGMYWELQEVFGLVKKALEDRLEEVEGDELEATEE